jgi:hypothetical protein
LTVLADHADSQAKSPGSTPASGAAVMRIRSQTLLAPAALLSLVLAACGGDGAATSTGTNTTTSTSGSGGQGGGDAGIPCPAGSHAGTSGACESDLQGWTAGPKLKHARDHHVTLAADTPAGAFLYVMAGMGSLAPPLQIERASIAADGTLGAFADIANLPVGLIGPGLAQKDRSFVLGGGLTDDSNSTASTYVGTIGDDGSVTVSQGPDMASSRYHVSLVYAKGFVYALGGLFQQVSGSTPTQDVLDVVERAAFDGTTLSPWETIAPLPVKLTHHATVFHDGAIYVIGGGSGLPASADILRATVADDGSLGAWETVGQLSEGRASPAATVFLNELFVIGGMTTLTGGEVDTVLAGSFDASGKLGAFQALSPLPKARAHSHQAPFYGGYLYSAGGSIKHVPQSDVFVGALQ